MKDKSKNRRLAFGIVAAIIVVGLAVAGLFWRQSRTRAAGVETPETGDVVTAFVGDLSASATASGKVRAVQSATLSVDNPGIVVELLAASGTEIGAGDPLIRLDPRDLALQVERAEQNVTLSEANLQALLDSAAEAEVAAAEAAVRSAQAALEELLQGPTAEKIAEYEANIRQQQAALASAAASFSGVRDSVSASALASAEAELVSAQIAYDKAREVNEKFAFSFTHEALMDAQEDLTISQTRVDELKAGPNQGNLDSAAADISAAQANLEKTRADYDALLAGPSAAEISAAEAQLASARADLANLLSGASEQDLTVARAELEKARLALADAQEALAKATVVAPFDGMVTDVLVSVGGMATGDVLQMVTSELKVVLDVDEMDIGALAVGQPAAITFEPLPDVEVNGRVASISPSASTDPDGIVSYDVTLHFDATDLPVLVGMTADAALTTARQTGILLVPNAAITADRRSGTYTVSMVIGEEDGRPVVESREVIIGLKDSQFTEVRSGLAEGDKVLVGELEAPTIDFGGPGFGNGGSD